MYTTVYEYIFIYYAASGIQLQQWSFQFTLDGKFAQGAFFLVQTGPCQKELSSTHWSERFYARLAHATYYIKMLANYWVAVFFSLEF